MWNNINQSPGLWTKQSTKQQTTAHVNVDYVTSARMYVASARKSMEI